MESQIEKKKRQRKIMVVGIGGVMALIMVIGMIAQVMLSNRPDPNAPFTATVEKASLGCRIKVDMTKIGEEAFKDQEFDKIQIYYAEDEPASAPAGLGEFTIAYPPKKAGDNVLVALLDKEGKPIKAIPVKLSK